MATQEKGEKKKAPAVPARRKKISSGASKRQAAKKRAYLAARTKALGEPYDRAKRRSKREGGVPAAEISVGLTA